MPTAAEQLADIQSRLRNISGTFRAATPIDGLTAADIQALAELVLATSIVKTSLGVATANGASATIKQISELVTLDDAAEFTDTEEDLLPADSLILCVAGKLVTAIEGATGWALEDATTAGRFATESAVMTIGATLIGTNQMQGSIATDAAGPVQTAAAKVRIATPGTPSAGSVRVTTTYIELVAPTS